MVDLELSEGIKIVATLSYQTHPESPYNSILDRILNHLMESNKMTFRGALQELEFDSIR